MMERRAFYPPGYSAFLVALYAVTGPCAMVALVANALLLVASTILTYAWSRQLAGDRTARLAAILFVLLAASTKMSQTALSEPLFITLTLVSVYWACGSWHWPGQVGAGLVLGMAHLVRSASMILPAAYFGAFLLLRDSLRRAVARTLLIGVVSLLVVLPWSVRNWRLFGRLVPVNTYDGCILWIGNHPGATGGYAWAPFPADVSPTMEEAEWNTRLRRHAVAAVLARPGLFLARMPAKLLYTLGFGFAHASAAEQEGQANVIARVGMSIVMSAILLGVVLQAGWAAVRLLRTRSLAQGWALVPFLLIAQALVIPLVMIGNRRYLYPAYPFIALSLAILCSWTAEALRRPVAE
jgi:4-amino-4-deoxy-L-arabinose transferase-like glycosyltransferase